RVHTWEPLHRDHSLAGSRLAFGRALDAIPRFEAAEAILAIEADFVGEGPGHLRHAREFMARRDPFACRLHAVESVPTLAGAIADHRVALDPSGVLRWLGEIDRALRGEGVATLPRVAEVARDLDSHRGRALVVAGESLPPEAHALVHE